jgi:phosphatidylinositol alpha-1,6-mannosyltransferase
VTVLSLLGPDGTGFETPFEVDWHGDGGWLSDKLRFSTRALRSALAERPILIQVAHVNLAPLAVTLGHLSGATTLLNVYGLEVWSGLSAGRRRAMRSVDRIVADCHFTSEYVTVQRMHAQKPDVIWDCIDLERFSPGVCPPETLRRYSIPDKHHGFVIMSLGRLDKRAAHKGYDRLIEVFARMRGEVERARLVIAGGGDDRPRLEALVANRGLEDAVTFIGSVAEADLADIYRAATVFSLVSNRGPGRGEGIPLTPLEAMGCGVPVIVGNQDGSREAVIGAAGQVANGFVVDPFDLDEHARLLVQLARVPAQLTAMQRQARIVAESYFGYDRFVHQHWALYESLDYRMRRCRVAA